MQPRVKNQLLSGAVKALFANRESETGLLPSCARAVAAAPAVAIVAEIFACKCQESGRFLTCLHSSFYLGSRPPSLDSKCLS